MFRIMFSIFGIVFVIMGVNSIASAESGPSDAIEMGLAALAMGGTTLYCVIRYQLDEMRSSSKDKPEPPEPPQPPSKPAASGNTSAASSASKKKNNAGDETPIADESDFEAEPGIKGGTSEKNSRKCPHCGADISDDIFCVNCGHRL